VPSHRTRYRYVSLLVPTGKSSPISKADVAFSNKKKHAAKVSQKKATELTSCPYQSAFQETRGGGILKLTLEI
jgi:hypothetical protein